MTSVSLRPKKVTTGEAFIAIMAGIPRSTYYDKNYKQSPALLRARRPYLVKNAITGTAIFAFAISVYAFTIRAVSQDEFEDVKVPDAPAQSPRAGASVLTTSAKEPLVGRQ